MSNKFWCRYCGKEKYWEERDYDMGLYLAEIASLDALGHTEGATPYLICKECAKDIVKEGEKMEKVFINESVKNNQPILFALDNNPNSEQPMIDFLINCGLKYEGKQNKDKYGFSRENVFISGNFKMVIFWMRNISTIQYMPDGWEGTFFEVQFDNIRRCVVGYDKHFDLAFCYGDTEVLKLAIKQ